MDCRELGIGIVPYSPIGRGFFGGRGVTEQVAAESNLVLIQFTSNTILGLHQLIFLLVHLHILLWLCQHGHPRFAAENLEKNKQIYLKMEELANKHQCSPAQLALAWVLHQGDDVVPIPGVTFYFHSLVIGSNSVFRLMVHSVGPKMHFSDAINCIHFQRKVKCIIFTDHNNWKYLA